MKRNTYLSYSFFIFLSTLLLLHACKKEKQLSDEELTLQLRWNKGFANEPYSNIETGLLWSLSYMGAEMPKGALALTVEHNTGDRVLLKLYNAGFSSDAKAHLAILISELKNTAEYKQTGGIDIGRFVLYTLYSPYHYYALTNPQRTYSDFKSRYVKDTPFQFAVKTSAVSSHERLITFSPVAAATDMAFIADDGTGSIEANNFEAQVHECWAIMPNGQLRYAIYNTQGNLLDASTSEAGKPGKCMWCHEIAVQPLYTTGNNLPGYLTEQEFGSWVTSYQSLLNQYRSNLQGEIDFGRKQDHALAELLYITFMEPSAARLALEWNMSETDVAARLNGLTTHVNAEYDWLGDLYNRKEVDALSPYTCMQVPDDVREKSSYEPDLFHLHQ